MKMFNKILMGSEFNENLLKTGVFFDGDEEAAVEDGAVVSVKGLMDHDLYTGLKDFNARKITAFDADAPIFGFIDYVGVSEADVMGVTYRVGDKTAGLAPAAGDRVRVRIPVIGDEFYLGDENFDGTPEVGKFAAPAAGETTLAVANAAAASGLCVEIEDTKTLITGQVNGGTLYRCRVISL